MRLRSLNLQFWSLVARVNMHHVGGPAGRLKSHPCWWGSCSHNSEIWSLTCSVLLFSFALLIFFGFKIKKIIIKIKSKHENSRWMTLNWRHQKVLFCFDTSGPSLVSPTGAQITEVFLHVNKMDLKVEAVLVVEFQFRTKQNKQCHARAWVLSVDCLLPHWLPSWVCESGHEAVGKPVWLAVSWVFVFNRIVNFKHNQFLNAPVITFDQVQWLHPGWDEFTHNLCLELWKENTKKRKEKKCVLLQLYG